MNNLIKAFNDNRNTGIGELRVAGPYKVKVFNGWGSHYIVETELEIGTNIVIDKVAPSENSHSTFGHINYIIRKDGTTESWSRANYWISLASSNLVPELFRKETNSNYSTNDNGTRRTRIVKTPNEEEYDWEKEYAWENFD